MARYGDVEVEYALARPEHFPWLQRFLLQHGPNEWNHLPEAGVADSFNKLESGHGAVMCAWRKQKHVGAPASAGNRDRQEEDCFGIGVYLFPDFCPEEWRPYAARAQKEASPTAAATGGGGAAGADEPPQPLRVAFLAEMCVHPQHSGHGIGSCIIEAIALHLTGTATAAAPQLLLMDRHEDNAASAGMMRKAGCTLLAVFSDPWKRPTGSRRTAVLQLRL